MARILTGGDPATRPMTRVDLAVIPPVREEGVPVSDNQAALSEAEAHAAALAALTAPVPETIGDGGPELVQLLTPEGERVDHVGHPEYSAIVDELTDDCLLYTSPSPRDRTRSR